MMSHVRARFGSLFQDFFLTKYNTIVTLASCVTDVQLKITELNRDFNLGPD